MTAYALLIGLGWFGTHRSYLGQPRSARLMMWITIVSVPLLFLGGIGIYGLYAVFFVMLVDLVAIIPLIRRRSAPRSEP